MVCVSSLPNAFAMLSLCFRVLYWMACELACLICLLDAYHWSGCRVRKHTYTCCFPFLLRNRLRPKLPRQHPLASPPRKRSGPKAKLRTKHNMLSSLIKLPTIVSWRKCLPSGSSLSLFWLKDWRLMGPLRVSRFVILRRRVRSRGSYTTMGNLSTVSFHFTVIRFVL